jgi:hypothetical protein
MICGLSFGSARHHTYAANPITPSRIQISISNPFRLGLATAIGTGGGRLANPNPQCGQYAATTGALAEHLGHRICPYAACPADSGPPGIARPILIRSSALPRHFSKKPRKSTHTPIRTRNPAHFGR